MGGSPPCENPGEPPARQGEQKVRGPAEGTSSGCPRCGRGILEGGRRVPAEIGGRQGLSPSGSAGGGEGRNGAEAQCPATTAWAQALFQPPVGGHVSGPSCHCSRGMWEGALPQRLCGLKNPMHDFKQQELRMVKKRWGWVGAGKLIRQLFASYRLRSADKMPSPLAQSSPCSAEQCLSGGILSHINI